MNINGIMKAKQAWDAFTANHPKFPGFINALRTRGMQPGDVIEIAVTGPDGRKIETNLRVTPGDLELFELLKDMRP